MVSSLWNETREQSLISLIDELAEVEMEFCSTFAEYLESDPDNQVSRSAESLLATRMMQLREARVRIFREAELQDLEIDDRQSWYEDRVQVEEALLERVRFRDRLAEAAFWGSAEAQYVHGVLLLGIGLLCSDESKDIEAGITWLMRAAEQDYCPAFLELGQVYLSSDDDEIARGFFSRGADLGCAAAQFYCVMDAVSDHSIIDPEERALLENIASRGGDDAQLLLGLTHANGYIGEFDHQSAEKWLKRAAARHRSLAIEWLREFEGMPAGEYEQIKLKEYQESWFSEESDPAESSGGLSLLFSLLWKLFSLGFLVLLVISATNGSAIGEFLSFLFICIALHELGHLLAARLVGIPIQTFCVGMGARAFSHVRPGPEHGTRYELRLIPLLGYVAPFEAPRDVWDYTLECQRAKKLGKEVPPAPKFDLQGESCSIDDVFSVRKRLVFYAGGLLMNLCLAFVCTWGSMNHQVSEGMKAAVEAGQIISTEEEAAARPQIHEVFLAIWEIGFEFVQDLPGYIYADWAGESPEEVPEESGDINEEEPFWDSGSIFWDLVWYFGLLNTLLLFLNLLPIPPLDGFHLLCGVFELSTGKKLHPRLKSILLLMGVVLLLVLLGRNLLSIIGDLWQAVFS